MEQVFKIYARAIVFDKEHKKILLIKKNNNQKIGAGQWMLPGGTVVWGEDVKEALGRKVKEECNLEITHLTLSAERKIIIGDTHWLGLYFTAEVKNINDLSNLERHKHETVNFVAMDFLPEFSDYFMYLMASGSFNDKEHLEVPTVLSKDHSMEEYLTEYVAMKMHPVMLEKLDKIQSITIVPAYDRNTIISKKEKVDKLFNYKRPTITIQDGVMSLLCFPSRDYVVHYTLLIKSHLASIKRDMQVSCFLPSTTGQEKAIENSIIGLLPEVDIVVFGGVDKLPSNKNVRWTKRGDVSYIIKEKNGMKMMYLGCQYSIWGDAAVSFLKIVHRLTKCKTFIYLGKVGVISNEIIPNETIAIIESSFVAGRIIESKNLFKVEEGMVVGAHYTLASVMQETKKFVESVKGKYLFIDPEIGYFVLAAKDLGVNFSQLHMVSDNVLNPHVENLSNERKKEVQEKRARLWQKIDAKIMELFD